MLSADAPNEEWCIVTSTLFQLDWKSLFPHQGLKAMHWMLSADAPNEEWCIVTSTLLKLEESLPSPIACLRNDPRHLCGRTASHPRRGRAASLGEDGNSCYQDIEWLRPHYPEKRKTRRSRMETRNQHWST